MFPPLKNDLILRVCKGEKVEKVPVWIMRQAGRYLPEFRETRAMNDFFTVCRTPELVAKVTLQPIDRYDGLLDASIIFSDILVIPQAMGLTVEMVPGKGPHFPEPLIDPSHLSRLVKPDVKEALGYVFEGITLTRHQLQGRVPLFGFIGAPWTLMAYMIEGGGSKTLSKAKTWLYKYPKESHDLLQRITDVAVEFLMGQIDAGAQLLQVFDSWAGELGPEEFKEFSLPYILQIHQRVSGRVPMAVFCRGAHYALEWLTDYDIISLDWTMDRPSCRQRVGTVLQGNADPSLLYGDKETIRNYVKNMVQEFGRDKWIANLGHGMYPDHDPEHLRWYLEAIRDFTQSLL